MLLIVKLPAIVAVERKNAHMKRERVRVMRLVKSDAPLELGFCYF